MKCFYLNSTFDSKCAAAIVKRKFQTCQLFPVMENDEQLLSFTGSDSTEILVVIDCLSNIEKIHELSSNSKLVFATSNTTLINDIVRAGISSYNKSNVLNKAVCEVIWDFAHPYDEIPIGVSLIADYARSLDTAECASYNAALLSYKNTSPDSSIWETILHPNSSIAHVDMLSFGRRILEYRDNEYKECAEHGCFMTRFHGYRVVAVNRLRAGSQFFKHIPKGDSAFMLSFAWVKDAWCITLYAHENTKVDVNEIAKCYDSSTECTFSTFKCSRQSEFLCKKLPFSLEV